ncbi:MAG TPA: glycosyltransferase [Opitutaceae bacterium]|nr:glycosyltransferase [Opitutaceae bacterium]
MSGSARLIHVAAWARTTGGVETLLARHARSDPRAGYDAWQVGLFDRRPPGADDRFVPLRFSWHRTPRGMRAAMAALFARHPAALTVWHNGWGLPWFADVDASRRRIACLVDAESQFGPLLAAAAPWLDGVTCLCEEAARAIRRIAPALAADGRVVVTPLPVAPGVPDPGPRPPGGDEWVIGCAGRLVRAQKRWDRLVPFVRALRARGARFRVEIVSDGPLRPWLQRQFAGDAAVQFLGWQDPIGYRRRMRRWDAAVFFSDHEGGPIVMLEAMAEGALPFYPAIGGSLGDEYAPQVEPRCLYPAADPCAAAAAVHAVLSEPPGVVARLRERARALAARHEPGAYDAACRAFFQHVDALPRRSLEPRAGRAPRLSDYFPLGWLTRFWPRALLR